MKIGKYKNISEKYCIYDLSKRHPQVFIADFYKFYRMLKSFQANPKTKITSGTVFEICPANIFIFTKSIINHNNLLITFSYFTKKC